jgi:2,3-bisphosphoglycerate-independent phosphoglycerate mutase
LKLIYTVIDGMGDLPIEELGNKTPLEAAQTPNMDFLAKTGKTGLMYTVREGIAPESDVAVISILGYDPFKYKISRGLTEALGAGLIVEDGDLALRCNFATLGRGDRIVDRRVGRGLTTDEAKELSRTINNEVKLKSYPVNFEFKSTIGHRGALVIRNRKKQLSGNITNTDPAYARVEGLGVAKQDVEMTVKHCKPMDKTEEARISAELVNEFTEKSRAVLEKHEINKKRAAKGALTADIVLTRDAGHHLPKLFNINEHYGLKFVCLADMPVERGISQLADMHLVDLPPPSESLETDCRIRVKALLRALPSHDCFYVHIKGPDEPGHDGDFRLKTQQIATVDEHFFGELLKKAKLDGYVVCVTADHATPCKLKAHSDDPVPLLLSGNKIEGDNVQEFSERTCKEGSEGVLRQGFELMPKLVAYLKS